MTKVFLWASIKLAIMVYLLCIIYRDNGVALTVCLAVVFVQCELALYGLSQLYKAVVSVSGIVDILVAERKRREKVAKEIFDRVCSGAQEEDELLSEDKA